jgi:type III secretion protein D
MSAAVLRIFSGLHIGAEIELIEGVYVIGTDDSCDLILSDSSLKARHAALRVSVCGDSVGFSA